MRKIEGTAQFQAFVVLLMILHFWGAAELLKMSGAFKPAGVGIGGFMWVWFGMPVSTGWLVKYTPFGRIWYWVKG